MPRSIDHVHKEIVRVANELGLDPRSRDYTRGKFLLSTDVTKHDLEYLGGWAKLKQDSAHVEGIPPENDTTATRGVELRNLYVRKLERKAATVEYFHERLVDSLEDVFSKNVVKLSTSKYVKKSKPTKKILTLLWSDLHFGVDVHPYEIYKSQFNWLVASRRMAKLCQAAVEWGNTQDTELRVILNGDIMQGVIHLDDSNLRPMTEQIWGATAILTSAIDFLRQNFGKITVECLPGNHDRMTYRSLGRSTQQRWDSHAHAVYLAMKMAFRNDVSVTFNIPTSGISLCDDMDSGYILVAHGDMEPTPNNVAVGINTDKLTVKLMKLKEGQAIDRKVSVALFGHWHTPTIQMLPNGTWVVVNGSLIGSEPYGQNIVGEFNSQPAQVMFDSEPGEPFNKVRIVKVKDADQNVDFDKIIPTPVIMSEGQLSI